MTETTPQQRAEWAALAEAATPGPWITHEMGRVFVGNQSDGRTSGLWEIVHMSGDDLSDLTPESAERHRQDAAFIAAAREAVPALLADIEAALGHDCAEAVIAIQRDKAIVRAEQAEAERDRLRAGIEALAEKYGKWARNPYGEAQLAHAADVAYELRALLAEGGSDDIHKWLDRPTPPTEEQSDE